jgi:hypothetical protein
MPDPLGVVVRVTHPLPKTHEREAGAQPFCRKT